MMSSTAAKTKVNTSIHGPTLIPLKKFALNGQRGLRNRLLRAGGRIRLLLSSPIASLHWGMRKAKCLQQQKKLVEANQLKGWRLRRAQRLEAMHYCVMGW
jgi:hypothetical protein